MSVEGFGASRDDEDFDFLDGVGGAPAPRREEAADLAAAPDEGSTGPRVLRKTRNKERKSRRYNKEDYVQISGVVGRGVKSKFDFALAREKVETGRSRKQFEVLESLMRFYGEHGDPYDLLEEG